MRSRSGGGGPSRGSGSRRARRSVACERGRAGLRQLRFECESRAIGRDLDLDLLRALRLSCAHLPTHPISQSHLRPIRRLPSRKNLDQILNGSSLGTPCNLPPHLKRGLARRPSPACFAPGVSAPSFHSSAPAHPRAKLFAAPEPPRAAPGVSHAPLRGPSSKLELVHFFLLSSRRSAPRVLETPSTDSRHAHPSLDGLNTLSL